MFADEVLRAAGEVGELRGGDINSQPLIERGEDVAEMDGAGERFLGPARGGAENLASTQAASGYVEHTMGVYRLSPAGVTTLEIESSRGTPSSPARATSCSAHIDRVLTAYRGGGPSSWGQRAHEGVHGLEALLQSSYRRRK